MINPKTTVFGAGVWGSVLAQHLARKGCEVTLWEHFPHILHEIEKHGRQHPHIPHFRLDDSIKFTSDMETAADGMQLGLLAISSKAVRKFAETFSRHLKGPVPFVSASKGIEEGTGLTVCEVIEDVLPLLKGQAMAFSGPSFALEVARGVPSRIVLAGPRSAHLEETKTTLDALPIRVETSFDRKGVEWGGAAKNVLAIACGIIDGTPNLGANTRAALFTKAAHELSGIIAAAGGLPETAYGLAGLGDLMLTGSGEMSRNHRLGFKLAQGKAVTQARGEISTVTEGADSAECVFALVESKKLEAPIVAAVRKILREGAHPSAAIKALGF